jgi:hypothetical protein
MCEPKLLLHGPDGEPWLPEDPFHGYEGPLAFGPGAEWGREFAVAPLETNERASN